MAGNAKMLCQNATYFMAWNYVKNKARKGGRKDGRAARELIGDDKSPVRYFVIGIVDEI